ncbi:MAG: glycosyltransferase family 4 protein [Pseudomonadota bacterium]
MYKIAVVIPKYGLVGGAEGFVANLTERIARDTRYDVHVFANKWRTYSSAVRFHKVPIISFPRFLSTVSFAYFAKLRITQGNFDLIHTHDRILAADVFTMHGIPHRIWVDEIRKKRMSLFDCTTEWVEKRLVETGQCSMFLSVSALAREKFLQQYNIEPERVQVLHPGVDVERFGRYDRERCRSEIRRDYGIGPAELVILFVSMNFAIKGLDVLLSGLAGFRARHPDQSYRILVAGKGDRRKYAKMAHELGMGDCLVFAGVMLEESLTKAYLASDAFAMISRFDTFGIAVLEAMAASIPVIVSNQVGASDLVDHGLNGFVVNALNCEDELIDALRSLADHETRMRMGREAHKTALDNTWDDVAEKITHVYQDLLNLK